MLHVTFFVRIYHNADEPEWRPVLLLSKQHCSNSNAMTNAEHKYLCTSIAIDSRMISPWTTLTLVGVTAVLHEPGQYMGRVNLKMLNQHPGSIPHHLLPHLSALSPEAQLTFLEGHMRPGCVHLVVDVMCTTNPAEWDVTAAAYCLMAFNAFWQHGTFLMQLPAGAVQWHDARIVKLWNAQELTAAMPSLVPGTVDSPMLQCVVSGQAARLQLYGTKARPAATAITKKEQSNAAKVLGRYMGKFVVNPDLQDCAACLQGSVGLVSRSAGEVVVPGLAGVGVLTLEAEQGSLLSAAQPVVVAPDVPTQQDVCKLVVQLQAAGCGSATAVLSHSCMFWHASCMSIAASLCW